MGFAEFIFGVVTNLISSVIYDLIKSERDFFKQRRIKQTIDNSIADVVQPLLPFLANEHIPEDKQRRLINACADELRPLTQEPDKLFKGSLNGQKIFDDLYRDRPLPPVVVEDGLKEIYTILFPRMATILCKIPATVKDWESAAWSENFSRLDALTDELRDLFQKVDELSTSKERDADALLTRVRQAVSQKIGLELDITGLRGNQPTAGRFDDFFVHPSIEEVIRDKEKEKKLPIRALQNGNDSHPQLTATNRRSIIIGQPGMGKSTVSKWLERQALKDDLCVRVELRSLSKSDNLPSLQDLIRDTAGKHLAEELTGEKIRQWLDKTQIIFILDGFDEIRPCDRDRIYEWIYDLSIAAPNCPIVITSRPLTTDHLDRFAENWLHWNIAPFDEERIIDYIQRWYRHMPLLKDGNREIDPLNLANTWSQDPTLAPLTGNPLLLSTLLMVHHLDGKLPSGRSELYKRYVEGMLGLWDDRRKVIATSLQITLEQKRQLLRGFALKMFLQQQDQVDETTALDLMHSLLADLNIRETAEDVLAGLRERSGLIIGPGIYSFVHKSVLEFLVAECVVQGDRRDESGCRIDRLTLFEHRDDDRWNTVIFLWAGLAPITDVESFVRQCLDRKGLELGYGILYDQYDRFSSEILRSFIFNTLVSNPQIKESIGYINHRKLYARKSEFKTPISLLRNIVSHSILFDDFFELSINKGDLTWSDIKQSKFEVLTSFWMSHASEVHNIEQWKICISQCCLEEQDYNYGITLALYYVCNKNIRARNSIMLEKMVIAFQDVHPELCPLFAVAFIGAWLESFIEIEELQSECINVSDFSSISSELKILNLIIDLGNSFTWENVMNAQEILAGTYGWFLIRNPVVAEQDGVRSRVRQRIGSQNQDLLGYFLDKLDQLIKYGLLIRDTKVIEVTDCIKYLIECREKILNEIQ